MVIPPALEQLIAHLARLPGIGEKTAHRLALHILNQPPDFARDLARSLHDVLARVTLCEVCFNLAEADETRRCRICRDAGRDAGLVCVVEGIQDLLALERAGVHRGLYHVLHGALSPLRGVGPDQLRVAPLLERARGGTLREVILATNVDVEGEATAVYLSRLLQPHVGRVTRIASGVPMGSDLEFMDQVTLTHAFAGRRVLS
jgi:recombination protein RecR